MGLPAKILILRFSSFGDVLQCLSVAGALRRDWPDSTIHWATRQDMAPLIAGHPAVNHLWTLDPQEGLSGLLGLARRLRRERYTHIYDAHNNLRSLLLSWLVAGPFGAWMWFRGGRYLKRSQFRFKRLMLFRFRTNLYPKPFNGQGQLLAPLRKWGVNTQAPATPQLFLDPASLDKARKTLGDWAGPETVALAPSAAYELKRWPVGHWKRLIQLHPQKKFVLLGGPKDEFFRELVETAPERVLNLAGQLSILESAAVVQLVPLLVANDTSVLHMAEQMGRPAVALMGPAPFGFPSRPATLILEKDLPCRPCSKHGQGPCINPKFHQCLVDITPQQVAHSMALALKKAGAHA